VPAISTSLRVERDIRYGAKGMGRSLVFDSLEGGLAYPVIPAAGYLCLAAAGYGLTLIFGGGGRMMHKEREREKAKHEADYRQTHQPL